MAPHSIASELSVGDLQRVTEVANRPRKPSMNYTDNTPWVSVAVIGVMAVCTGAQYSVYFSSMWPYLQKLDSHVSEPFFGLCVALYSLGQITTAPLAGWWSNRIKQIRSPIIACITLQTAGNVVYFLAQVFPQPYGKYAVMFGRFLCGAGSSNIGLLKTYGATASTSTDRSRAIAIVTGGIALGLICGPSVQLIFTPIGEVGWKITENLALNMYTTPPVAICLVNLTAMCIMGFIFHEKYAGLTTTTTESNGTPRKLAKADTVGLTVCFVARFTQMFVFSSIETLSTPIAMTMFAMTRSRAVEVVSLVHGIMSLLELTMYGLFIFAKLDRWTNFRLACLVGYLGMALFYIITYSYPFIPGHLKVYSENDFTLYEPTNLTEPSGCNVDSLSWCEWTSPTNFWVYYISFVVLMASGFCLTNITLNTIFSHVIGPRRQGTHQGVLQMVGSFGRLSGPILISNLYTHLGIRYSWTLMIVTTLITVVVWTIFYKHLIPIEERMDKEALQKSAEDSEIESKGKF